MKSRLTITLTKNVLKKVDKLVDGKDIRNRSHAIEHLIRKSLTPAVNKAIILAGGKIKGETLPLLSLINHRPLLFVLIEHLKKYKVTEFIICAGKHEGEIKKILNNGEAAGIKIIYSKESKPLGTAGAVKNAEKYLSNESFLVVHGDVLTGMNFENFIEFHEREDVIATMAVKPRKSEKNYGKVLLQGNKITDFIGLDKEERGISIVNTGVYLFEPEILDLIPDKFPSSFEKDIFPRLAKTGELGAFIFQGVWADVSKVRVIVTGNVEPSKKETAKKILDGIDSLPADISSVKGSKKRLKEAWGHFSNMSPDDHE